MQSDSAIWLDNSHLYWTQVGGPDYDSSLESTQLWRIQKTVDSEAELPIDHIEESAFVQDTDFLYFVSLATIDTFSIYILPINDSSNVIERDLAVEFRNNEFNSRDDEYRSLAVGDEAIYLRVNKDRQSGRLIAVPKDPTIDIRVYEDTDVSEGILGIGGDYIFLGMSEFIQAHDLSTEEIDNIFQPRNWVMDLKYYSGQIIFSSQDYQNTDDDGLHLSRLIKAPVPPSGSSADTVELVELRVEPETGADFYFPDPHFDVSGSGLFWTEPFNDSAYRRRIIRRKDL